MKKVICDECGKVFEVSDYEANQARIINFYICKNCTSKVEVDDPLEGYQGFPKLQGSKKQIEWAIDIRQKMLNKFGKRKNNNFPITWNDFQTQSEASWWIENRKAR